MISGQRILLRAISRVPDLALFLSAKLCLWLDRFVSNMKGSGKGRASPSSAWLSDTT